MKSKTLYTMLAFVLLVSMVLSACAQQPVATQAPTQAPTQAQAPTAPPVANFQPLKQDAPDC